MLENYLLWFKHHERLLIILAVLIFSYSGVSRWLNYDAAQKDAKVAALTAVVEQDKQTVANLALQAATAQTAYQTTLDAITKQNIALSASIARQGAILAQSQAKDRQMPLPELGQRMEALVPAAKGGITATSNGLALDNTASHSIANELEKVPVLTDQVAKETQVAQNNADVASKAQKVNVDLTAQVNAMAVEGADAAKQCKAEVSAEKVKTKKAFVRGFKWGAIVGFIGGIWTGHVTGI